MLDGRHDELAHDIAVHIAFAKPAVPHPRRGPGRRRSKSATLLEITKAEGKPEAAWPKIVEGRLTGWYKERVLVDQPYVRDDKQTVAQLAEAAAPRSSASASSSSAG